jgi:hypothetical protein
LFAGHALAAPLGPGFTYQGQLNQNGAPVNGNVNLRFSLHDAATVGNQVGASQVLTVTVTNGLFTALLNGSGEFGANAFNGDARWLQIEVCNNPACSSSTTLSPRQSLTAAPYATTAAKPWSISGANIGFLGGNVGIGTTSPQAPLDVRGEVKLGTTGQYFAPGSAESLRILRGTIGANGNIYSGTGFSVFYGTLGIYELAFTAGFPQIPTITATAEYSGGAPLFAMCFQSSPFGVKILVVNHAGVPAEGIVHFTAIGSK